MKITALFFMAFFLIASTGQVYSASQSSREITGLEWLKMSADKRLDYIVTSMYVLTNHGVDLEKSPNSYYKAVEERLRFNPDFYSANVANILASIVYETEPGARAALDQIRKKSEVKKIEMH